MSNNGMPSLPCCSIAHASTQLQQQKDSKHSRAVTCFGRHRAPATATGTHCSSSRHCSCSWKDILHAQVRCCQLLYMIGDVPGRPHDSKLRRCCSQSNIVVRQLLLLSHLPGRCGAPSFLCNSTQVTYNTSQQGYTSHHIICSSAASPIWQGWRSISFVLPIHVTCSTACIKGPASLCIMRCDACDMCLQAASKVHMKADVCNMTADVCNEDQLTLLMQRQPRRCGSCRIRCKRHRIGVRLNGVRCSTARHSRLTCKQHIACSIFIKHPQ
jgi:hypothetical protein